MKSLVLYLGLTVCAVLLHHAQGLLFPSLAAACRLKERPTLHYSRKAYTSNTMSPTDELPKPPAALLDQIRLGNIPLRPSFTEAEDATAVSRPAAVSETMLRGGLLHEIATGKKLRHVADRVSGNKDAAPSATISRGGFLHELRMRTPLAASTSSASVVSAARSSGASQRVSSAPSSGGSR